MKRSKFSEAQVLGILKAVENGRTVAEVCRENSISDSTYFNWKAKYGGMTAAEIKRLRELEERIGVRLAILRFILARGNLRSELSIFRSRRSLFECRF